MGQTHAKNLDCSTDIIEKFQCYIRKHMVYNVLFLYKYLSTILRNELMGHTHFFRNFSELFLT